MDKALTYSHSVFGQSFLDGYFKLWALVLPITSVVLIPSIQGTTPAYIMAFLSLPVFLIAARLKDIRRYLTILFFFALGFITLSLASQFFLSLYGGMDLSNLPLVDPLYLTQQVILRPTLFTQTLYLMTGLLTLLFVLECYNPSWDRYIFAGILLLVVYGFYEVSYYWLTGHSGDFLSNRVFNQQHSGSLFQTIRFGDIRIQRMKSLTGEPSMFAFTVLPYWIFALHTRRYSIAGILTLALVLSTSTTAIVGIVVYCGLLIISGRVEIKYLLAAAGAGAVIVIIKFQTVWAIFNKLVIQKLSAESVSGMTRLANLKDCILFWLDAPLPTKFFGLGFGYVRSTDFFSTLLVNNGLIGLAIMALAFGYPILALGSSNKEFGLKCALIVIAVSLLSSIPEFAYLSIWLFLGISYNYLNHKHDAPAQHLYRRSS